MKTPTRAAVKIKAYVADIRDEFKFKSEMTEIVLKKLLEEKMIKGADHAAAEQEEG